jgi:hypothetical protein
MLNKTAVGFVRAFVRAADTSVALYRRLPTMYSARVALMGPKGRGHVRLHPALAARRLAAIDAMGDRQPWRMGTPAVDRAWRRTPRLPEGRRWCRYRHVGAPTTDDMST